MNWIEKMYRLNGKDLYAQSGEGYYLEYVFDNIPTQINIETCAFADIGGGDGFYLSNTRHLGNLGWKGIVLDRENGVDINLENVNEILDMRVDLLSIDIDGNDFWILDKILKDQKPSVIIAEFNAMYTDSRAIRYNPDHVWAGDSYYGFTFKAGEKLAELHGYKVIFQIADMNMIMVRTDLIEGLHVPEVIYKQNDYFKLSDREDWIKI